MILTHGGGGEKSDSFSRQGEQDRPVLWNLSNKQISCNCSRRTVATEIFLGKTIFNVRQKGVPPLLLPASVLQLPRCLARIYNLDSYHSTLFELESFKKCNCSRENLLQNNLLRKCGLLAHTSAAFLKNCCTEKLFICLRLGSRNQSCTLPLFAENTALSCNLLEIMVQ